MAIYPDKFETQFRDMPGMHGEVFHVDAPGYRAGEARINRTNNRLNITPHEALSQKYLLDTRLRPLFRYGFAVGYNYLTVTKGRIVAADPYRNAVDWTADKQFNTLTLANGGVPVKVRGNSDVYPTSGTAVSSGARGQKAYMTGLEWAPVVGIEEAYKDGYFNALKDSPAKQMEDANLTVDNAVGDPHATGNLKLDGVVTKDYRPANKPLGMIERNEYNRFDNDSMDGMQPGPIITDAIVELPYFAFKDKAESNPWGSVYGSVQVGDLVKSDENGRIVPSPLCVDALLEDMTPAQIERERQQVIGQIIAVNHDMVPEGGYKWATWALEDRLKYEGFAPDLYSQNNRPGEDAVASSVYQSTGRYPGYPYDSAYTEHDLHMLASNGRKDNFDKFMNAEWEYEHLGIPGLTDGYNAAVRNLENNNAAVIRPRASENGEYIKQFVRVDPHGNIEANSLSVQLVKVDEATKAESVLVDWTNIANNTSSAQALDDAFQVEYFSEVQGQLVISVKNATKADEELAGGFVKVNLKYVKRGEAGVPTFMDWDGCVGSVKVLLQR